MISLLLFLYSFVNAYLGAHVMAFMWNSFLVSAAPGVFQLGIAHAWGVLMLFQLPSIGTGVALGISASSGKKTSEDNQNAMRIAGAFVLTLCYLLMWTYGSIAKYLMQS